MMKNIMLKNTALNKGKQITRNNKFKLLNGYRLQSPTGNYTLVPRVIDNQLKYRMKKNARYGSVTLNTKQYIEAGNDQSIQSIQSAATRMIPALEKQVENWKRNQESSQTPKKKQWWRVF